ncbi:MAG: hypothetical protein ACKO4Z_03555 [Planctomycetota bacterium]
MIVLAVGLTSEPIVPITTPGPRRSAATEWPPPVDWLVLSADPRTRDRVLETIRRDGLTSHAALARAPQGPPGYGRRYRCAFVDLVHAVGDDDGMARWLEALRLYRTRLAIRGADGDSDHERRARVAGAVAYLPGEIDPRGLARLVTEISRLAA